MFSTGLHQQLFVAGSPFATLCRFYGHRRNLTSRDGRTVVMRNTPDELLVRATSPSVMGDPDAVDIESAEEGWRSEDPQRRGVAARSTAGVLSGPGHGAAPPVGHTAAR